MPNVTIISRGTIVNIFSTRCDKITECWGNEDENNCGGFSGLILEMGYKVNDVSLKIQENYCKAIDAIVENEWYVNRY